MLISIRKIKNTEEKKFLLYVHVWICLWEVENFSAGEFRSASANYPYEYAQQAMRNMALKPGTREMYIWESSRL